MEKIFENNEIINYKSIINNESYEATFNKNNNVLTLKINSNILANNDSIVLFGKIYKEAISNIQNCKDVNFQFFPSNEIELKNANSITSSYMINNKSYIKPIERNNNKVIEDYFKANMITKNDNGNIITYVERKADSNNNSYILENISIEDMKEELENIINETELDLNTLTDTEIACLVLDRISNIRKQYYMESSDKYSAQNEKQQAALNAAGEDDKVNTEIGIVKKDVADNSFNTYRAIEQDGDNYKVVTPTVNEISSVNTINDNNNEIELDTNEIEDRQEEKIYYIDNYTYDIYVQLGTEVTKIGNLKDGNYKINFENNTLILNDKELGPIDDINNMGKTVTMNKPKVKTLTKEDNKGNVNLSIICLILGIITFLSLMLYLFIS